MLIVQLFITKVNVIAVKVLPKCELHVAVSEVVEYIYLFVYNFVTELNAARHINLSVCKYI